MKNVISKNARSTIAVRSTLGIAELLMPLGLPLDEFVSSAMIFLFMDAWEVWIP
jgi:hypothetical protein